MRRFLRGVARPSLVIAGICALYALAYNILPSSVIYIALNAVVIGIWVLMIRAYTPPLIKVIRRDAPTEERNLIIGIVVLWTAFAASRVWVTAAIMMGRPDWMANHWILQFSYVIAGTSGYWFLSVPQGKTPCGYPTYAMLISIAIVTLIMLFEYLH